MKRKIAALICAIALTFGLTACGSTENYNSLQEQKVSSAENLANMILQLVQAVGNQETVSELTRSYNKEELRAVCQNAFQSNFQYSVEADLGAFDGLLTSYAQMAEDMGGEPTMGPSKSKVVGKEIIVTFVMYGSNCDGEVVFTFSNDVFTRFKSGAASAKTTFAQKMNAAGRQMGNAGLNTLLGMGSVFIVLILISLIISSFSLLNRKDSKKETKAVPASVAAAPAAVTEELVDDSELVAVITAAICAYESANGGSADGFVVRSIRKANRRR
ncbi:MAG: OadG family protein [Lachnospiraceae bacterium]|nr:OadG family protein [Lachnospiraceae bacterium]